jgi:hypothetical protein
MSGKSHPFEIVMEGFDRYYRKEWSGKQEKIKAEDAGFWMVQLVVGDFGGGKSLSWREFGSRGGGNYGEIGECARRFNKPSPSSFRPEPYRDPPNPVAARKSWPVFGGS